MKQSEIEQLFKKFLNDQCTQDEVRTLLNLIEKGKYPTYLEPLLDQYWNKLKHYHTLDSIHSKKLLVNIKSSIERRNRTLFQNIIWKIAASIVLVVGLGLFGYVLVKSPGTTKPEWITKEARIGEKLNVVLADGTVVKLNADSRMSYPSEFGKTRVVKLQGEAFFEVEPDPDHPFVVQSGDLTTTVLGTSFNVQAYPDEPQIQVTVATGKVRVEAQGSSHNLIPSQQATYHFQSTEITVERTDLAQSLAWEKGVLHFVNASEEHVLKRLERWYGVDFKTEGSTKDQWNVNGRYQDKSLEFVLNSLSYSVGFSYRINNKNITINYNQERM